MDIEKILSYIPKIDVFMTVDEMDKSTFELKEKYPDVVTIEKAGESRQGHPLYCLKIGNGRKKALMYGCPHPNEPIGCMMLEHFSWILCEHKEVLEELDTTFYMIKAIDPDGLNMNKGWLKGPFTYASYASNFYRPVSDAQVEWTFPIDYKNYSFHAPINETKILMKLMDEIKPDFVYSLHNSSFGGVYFYVSKNDPMILSKLPLAAKRASLPLNLGEPECAFSKIFAPAIYEILSAVQYYDYYEKTLPGDPCEAMICGGSSLDYMNKVNPNAFILMCEEPYFYCPDSADASLCENMTRKEAILKGFEIQREVTDKLRELVSALQKYASSSSFYMRSLHMYTESHEQEENAQRSLMTQHPEAYEQLATKASRFDSLIARGWYPLLAFGMVKGCVLETMNEHDWNEEEKKELQDLMTSAQSYIDEKCAQIEAQMPCQPIEIRKLVSVQMESAIIVLENLEVNYEN